MMTTEETLELIEKTSQGKLQGLRDSIALSQESFKFKNTCIVAIDKRLSRKAETLNAMAECSELRIGEV